MSLQINFKHSSPLHIRGQGSSGKERKEIIRVLGRGAENTQAGLRDRSPASANERCQIGASPGAVFPSAAGSGRGYNLGAALELTWLLLPRLPESAQVSPALLLWLSAGNSYSGWPHTTCLDVCDLHIPTWERCPGVRNAGRRRSGCLLRAARSHSHKPRGSAEASCPAWRQPKCLCPGTAHPEAAQGRPRVRK